LILGLDASNLLGGGGGLTHLTRFLAAAEPLEHGIERLIVWARRDLLDRLPDREWIEGVTEPALEAGRLRRLAWQRRRLPRLAAAKCDVLFAPGGSAGRHRIPVVVMCRNMLPFEPDERGRYGLSWMGLRLALLRRTQGASFRRAEGLIFLTRYAQETVSRQVQRPARWTVIPHGVDEIFRCKPRPPRTLQDATGQDPLRVLYVSIVDVYKHQWQVARAVAELRAEGLPVSIDFVGPAYPPALGRLRAALEELDPDSRFLRYLGPVAYGELPQLEHAADLFVFASSCENMPNVLLEAMAAGLPIACAARGPMPEVLGDAGTYFDPEHPGEIAAAIRRLAVDAELRSRCAARAYARAEAFTWTRCARETLAFLASIARGPTEADAAP
jgi:glycosyltransferase involved in cell wall biosynthesis